MVAENNAGTEGELRNGLQVIVGGVDGEAQRNEERVPPVRKLGGRILMDEAGGVAAGEDVAEVPEQVAVEEKLVGEVAGDLEDRLDVWRNQGGIESAAKPEIGLARLHGGPSDHSLPGGIVEGGDGPAYFAIWIIAGMESAITIDGDHPVGVT